MSAEERKKAYLTKAKEAETQAQRTPDGPEKERWLKIAQGYRDLANTQVL